LATQALNTTSTQDKINAMRKLGVPYPAGYENMALADLQKQADEIAKSLNKSGIQGEVDDNNNIVTPLNKTEIVAIIAYLQRMGKEHKQAATKPLTLCLSNF
jgi:cytochrome c oxidase cbb3-type subunit I/II